MATLTITIPDDRAEFLRQQAAGRGFASVEAYVDSLLRDAQDREARRKRIDELPIEGIESGPSDPMTREDWDSIRREGLARLDAKRRTR